MAVPVGSTVSFPNFDTIYHNVFSLSKTKPFDLGMYKSGETREVKVDKPGIVRLGCNIHANMSAYIVVVDAPHYVVDADGAFEFKNLAPGKYKVQGVDGDERRADQRKGRGERGSERRELRGRGRDREPRSRQVW